MAKLKSLTKWPPGGFQVLIPEAGMKEPFSGGFYEAVTWLLAFVRRNPSMAQRLNLPTDEKGAELWVDQYNARRCIAGGWLGFVDMDTVPETGFVAAQKKTLLGRVVGGARKGRAALSAYVAMFGAAGPVPKDLAESRASVCASCPKNDKVTTVWDHFAAGTARQIMAILGALKDLDLATSRSAELGICRSCDCPMKAKIWSPIGVVVEKMPPETWPLLPRESPRCWILQESGRE